MFVIGNKGGGLAMIPARPFRAFVSYCHADAAFAARLQRKLESYRLPRRLAGRVAPLPGQAPGRIGPVFRDREDLSAAADLSEAVREAIALSSALVVVASPDAARSQWVEREITLFREHHPGAPILVALARGEPAEALPAALRTGAEPLAADFRPEGDGKRLAFLKIVAGLACLPVDALVQRDAQRQVRRVMGVTLGAAALVVVMAVLLVVALDARAEAERRRTSAEEMIEKMITDVRQGLEGTGNVKLMSAVNQLAMDYYHKQGHLTRLPDDSLQRRARVLHKLGEDDEKRNLLDAAFAKFAEAHQITSQLLAKYPRDPDAIFAHAQSEYYLGLIALRRKDRATAALHWNAYLRLARALAREEPGSARSLLEQGYANGNLCDLNRQDQFNLKAAEAQCNAAVDFEQAALLKSSELILALANRHGALALLYFRTERYAEAMISRRNEASLLDPLIAIAPDNIEYALRRSWADIGMANIWVTSHRPAEAVAVLRQSLARHRGIFDRESDDGRVIETRLRIYLFLARALRDLGQDHAAALSQADRQETLMIGLGTEPAAKAEAKAKARAIRASIWIQ